MIGVQKVKKSGTVYYRVVTSAGTKSWSAKKYGAGEARKLAHQFLNNNSTPVAAAKFKLPTLEKVIFDYEDSMVDMVEYSTWKQLRNVNRRWLKTKIANMKINEITVKDVQDAVQELKAKYSEDAINRSVVRLKAAAKKAEIDYQTKDYSYKNMIDNYVNQTSLVEKDRRNNIERPIPSVDHVKKLLANSHGYLNTFISIAVMTGLRPSEIRGLKWEAIDFDNNSIAVSTKADEQNRVSVRLKNKNAYRSVPLVPQLKQILWHIKSRPSTTPYGLVLATKNGNPLPHNQISAALDKLKSKLGIDGWVGLHGFRHYYASVLLKNMIQLGLDFKQVPAILGHKDFGFTSSVYGHVLTNAQEHKLLCQKLDSNLLLN